MRYFGMHSADSPENQPRRTLFYLLLTAFPILLTYALLFSQMRGLPMFDDFQAVILYSVQLHQLHGFTAKFLYALAAQHDEYKLIFEHLVMDVQFLFTSHLQYRVLTALGNLFPFGILAVYWRESFSPKPMWRRLMLFAPISMLIFQLNYAETLDWAMCGLQMLPVIFFTVLAFHFLLRDSRPSLLFACSFALFACLASANGFVAAPVGLLILLQRRRFRIILVWSVPFFLGAAAYLYRYHLFQRPLLLLHPTFFQKVVYFLSFVGAAIENVHHFPVRGGSIALGLVILGAWVYSVYARFYRDQPFVFYAFTWLLISAAGVAQLRIGLGLDGSLTLRYKIYSDLMMVSTYLVAVWRLDRPVVRPQLKRGFYLAALAATVLLNLSSDYFGYKFLERRRESTEIGFQRYLAKPASISPEVSNTDTPISGGEPEFSRQVMNQAIAEGIFVPPVQGGQR